jgi:amino acid transporter
MFTAVAVALSFAIFLGNFLGAFGIELGMLPMVAVMLVFVAAVTYGAYTDVKMSSRAGLVLEVISIAIIVLITVLFVRVRGTVIDRPQLQIAAFNYGAVFSALPFVIFSFVGFESSATLAKESANPRKNIPLAVIGCGAFAGIFFTFIAYFMVFGMGDDTLTLGASSAPFSDVAAKAGLGWTSVIVYFAAMISVFACCLASVYPVPAYPYNILPYAFFAYMIVGAIWFAMLKSRSPQTLASIQHDMEG